MILALILAFSFALLLARTGIPPLVGYLAAGFVFSTAGFVLPDIFHILGELGVMFLLFGVGLHIRFSYLLDKNIWVVGFLHLVIGVAIFIITTMVFGLDKEIAVFMGIVLGFSSTVLAAKSLEDRGELGALHARYAIGILILQDIFAIALMAYLSGDTPSTYAALLLLLPLAKPILNKLLTFTTHGEVILLFGILLAIGSGELFVHLNLPAELGAVVAGAMFADHPRMEELGKRIWAIREALLVVFFFSIGAAATVTLTTLGYALLVMLILPFKAIFFYSLFAWRKMKARTAFLAGLALTTYSEFALIASHAGMDSGVINEEIMGIISVAVALSFAINIPINRFVNWIYFKYEHVFKRLERHVDNEDEISVPEADYFVVGMGRTGSAAFSRIDEKGGSVVGIEMDQIAYENIQQDREKVIYGDALDLEFWEKVPLKRVKGIILAIPNLDAKILVAQYLRSHGYTNPLHALALFDDDVEVLKKSGVDYACHALREAGIELADTCVTANSH